jgi:hypothetical protein
VSTCLYSVGYPIFFSWVDLAQASRKELVQDKPWLVSDIHPWRNLSGLGGERGQVCISINTTHLIVHLSELHCLLVGDIPKLASDGSQSLNAFVGLSNTVTDGSETTLLDLKGSLQELNDDV